MKQIFKQRMNGRTVETYGVGKVVHVDMQEQFICFWYEYDHRVDRREFTIVGTGHEFNGDYVGTVIDGSFVWHLIEI